MSGLTIDGSGQGWEFDYNGNLWRLDIQTGMSQAAGHLVPIGSGWYKDLAWDSVNSRVLGMHFGSLGVTIGVVDTSAGRFISLGTVAGIPPGGHFTGLAVGPNGEMAISDDGAGYVWDVTEVAGGFTAVRRSVRATFGGGPLEGLEYDPQTGDLLACGPVNRVLPDGSLQSLRPDVTGFDIAFVPVPAPGAAWVIAGAAGTLAVRRRSRRLTRASSSTSAAPRR
jgi:hypothetical protein